MEILFSSAKIKWFEVTVEFDGRPNFEMAGEFWPLDQGSPMAVKLKASSEAVPPNVRVPMVMVLVLLSRKNASRRSKVYFDSRLRLQNALAQGTLEFTNGNDIIRPGV